MNFFNNPITAEQFHNALAVQQETSNLVATHNANHPDNGFSWRDVRHYFTEKGYDKVSAERKENVAMCMSEAAVKRYNETTAIVKTVRDHAKALESMGRGIMAAVEGNSKARRDRLWLSSLEKHLEVVATFRRESGRINWNFGEVEAQPCTLPTAQSVNELRVTCSYNSEGLKYETDTALRAVAQAAEEVVLAIRQLPFPENDKQELLDAANEHAGQGAPRIYGDTMASALVKLMVGLTPTPCVEADLGADWEAPTQEVAAFDALRACVTLDDRDAERVAKWHANLLQWIEKRAQVAQG